MRVRNWDKWQSYRSDRGQPPWIKIHREVMRNPQWVALTDEQRGQLVSIWILAADKNGEIPDDPTLIRKLCYMDSNPDLQVLISNGFLECDADVTPERRHSDQPEAEKKQRQRQKKKESKERPSSSDEVEQYAKSIGFDLNGKHFIDYYEANGWMRGKNKIKDWKACVRTWKQRSETDKSQSAKPNYLEGVRNV